MGYIGTSKYGEFVRKLEQLSMQKIVLRGINVKTKNYS